MWRIAARIHGAGLCRPAVGGVFGRGLATTAFVRAAATLPIVSNLEQPSIGTRSRHDLYVALGLAAGAGVLLAEADVAECAPKRKGGSSKAAAKPAAEPATKTEWSVAPLRARLSAES